MIESLADVMVMKGVPEHIRSDNGPEFVAKDLRKWLADTGAKTLYIEPGSPWENGYCESFNSKLRDEFLNGEIFYSLKEVQVLAERWRVHYNTVRPHSSLSYRPPAPEVWMAKSLGCGEVGRPPTLKNLSSRSWTAKMTDGTSFEVPRGGLLKLTDGFQIHFVRSDAAIKL